MEECFPTLCFPGQLENVIVLFPHQLQSEGNDGNAEGHRRINCHGEPLTQRRFESQWAMIRPSQEAACTAKIHWAPHVSWDPAPVDGESEPAKCELQAHGQSNCLYSDRHLAGRLPVSSEKLGGLAPQHDPAVQLELNIIFCDAIVQCVFTGPKFLKDHGLFTNTVHITLKKVWKCAILSKQTTAADRKHCRWHFCWPWQVATYMLEENCCPNSYQKNISKHSCIICWRKWKLTVAKFNFPSSLPKKKTSVIFFCPRKIPSAPEAHHCFGGSPFIGLPNLLGGEGCSWNRFRRKAMDSWNQTSSPSPNGGFLK